jgi:GDP-4-dehydro-6-deoxy-D-mannose reductase
VTTALITGISGFVGPYLARELVAHGVAVHGLGLHPAEPAVAESGASYHRLDLLDAAATRRCVDEIQPDLVFHLAALASPSMSWSDPARFFTNNTVGQINLLEAVRAVVPASRVLVVASSEVYGIPAPSEIPTNEDVPLRPRSPYAASKAAQDLLAYQYHAGFGLNVIRVRPFNHLGPGQSDTYVAAAFASQIARIEAGLQPPEVHVGNLAARRDFTDVRDIVRAYWLALTKGEPGAVYNVGSGHPQSIQLILDRLRDLARVPVEVHVDPARLQPIDLPVTCCDASRLQAVTGWKPQIPFNQTIEDILNDWRERVRL